MLLDFRKAKNTCLAARVFLRFSTVSQHPMDHVIQTRKTIGHYFNPSQFSDLNVNAQMRTKDRCKRVSEHFLKVKDQS